MLIGIAGMVGSGKTTLARALASRFGLQIALESVDGENPWLEPFYASLETYALHLQLRGSTASSCAPCLPDALVTTYVDHPPSFFEPVATTFNAAGRLRSPDHPSSKLNLSQFWTMS